MARTSSASAKQAKKKHAKELQRKALKTTRWHSFGTIRHAPSSDTPSVLNSKRFDPGIELLAAQERLPYFLAAFAVSNPDDGTFDMASVVWTLDQLSAMDTSEILVRMETYGLHVSQEAFQEGASRFRSAIAFAREVWIPGLPSSAVARDRDFVFLGTHELWKRWCGDAPSREMAIEAFLHLQDCNDAKNWSGTIRHGVDFWRCVKPELGPDLRTFNELDKRLEVKNACVLHEMSDFAMAANIVDPETAKPAIAVLEEMVQQFTGESQDWHFCAIQDLADVLYKNGETERAEAMLREVIAGHPQRAGGYVTLADLWAFTDEGGKRRALELLEQAAAVPVKDGIEYDLHARINWLHERLDDLPGNGSSRYEEMAVERLVRLLQNEDHEPSEEFFAEIRRRGDAAVTPLRRVVDAKRYCGDDECSERIALRQAFRLLGEIGSVAAAKVLIDAIAAHSRDVALPWDALGALDNVVPDATPMLLEAAMNVETKTTVRVGFVFAAYELAVDHVEHRPTVAAFVTNILRGNDKELVSYLAQLGARVDTPEAYAAVKAIAGDTGILSEAEWVDMMARREHQLWMSMARSWRETDDQSIDVPLRLADIYQRTERMRSDLLKAVRHIAFKQPSLPTATAKPIQKLGRNDPCHCGSGKKYKKCCLQ